MLPATGDLLAISAVVGLFDDSYNVGIIAYKDSTQGTLKQKNSMLHMYYISPKTMHWNT